jgi:hypothetical protein
MVEYLQLWDLLQEVVLQPEVEDTHSSVSHLQANIQQNQHMKAYSWGPPISVHGIGFGRHGHHQNADFSCG